MDKHGGWLGATITDGLSEEVIPWPEAVCYLTLARFYCDSPAKPGSAE